MGQSNSRKKILIVDDSKTIHNMLSSVLINNGYAVVPAMNGEECIALAKEISPDLILLDRQMPVMDGNETLKTLKADNALAKIPVIMLTADKELKDMSQSLELGAQDYVVKPFIPYDLIMRINKLLDTGKRFWQKTAEKE